MDSIAVECKGQGHCYRVVNGQLAPHVMDHDGMHTTVYHYTTVVPEHLTFTMS